MNKDDARDMLHQKGLRITAPRVAVLQLISKAQSPLSHTEVLDKLGNTEWDPATIYRNLVKLREVGLTTIASRADGIDRYAMRGSHDDSHRHPHFVCEDCGQVTCLPLSATPSVEVHGIWAASMQQATIQFRGECPECIEASESTPHV